MVSIVQMHLAGRDRLAGLDGEAPDGAGAVRVHLVLHLHRLDDADHPTGLDLVAVGDRDREDRPLHRRNDRVAATRTGAAAL